MQKEISINICGDFYLNTLSADEKYFTEDILELFHQSDYNIVNLESPVAKNNNNKIYKTGPCLSGSPHTFLYLKQIRTNLVTLANNHLMDFGQQGLYDTLTECRFNSINHVGAGMSLEEAGMPFILEKDEIKVAILNFAENEWSAADVNKSGANPLDIIENVRQIRKAREVCDFVLVIVHGGIEFYHLPTSRMVSQYRFFAENGASVIIGHHPHCISGMENYQGVPIFYSLGNFLFTMRSKRESWYTGIILNLKLRQNRELFYELIPVSQDKSSFTLTLLEGEDKQNVNSAIEKYSAIISDEKLMSENWNSFVEEQYEEKIDIFSPVQVFSNKYIIKILQKSGMNRYLRRKKQYAQILNHIRCESLNDISKCVLKKFIKK